MSILHCRSITTSNNPNTTTDHSFLQNLKQPRNTEPDKRSLLEARFVSSKLSGSKYSNILVSCPVFSAYF